MKLVPHGSNQNVLIFDNGIKVLFSYQTPVAAFHPIKGWLRTDKKFSNTTSKHINKWLAGLNASTISQSFLDNLVVG
ncbi:hypothetical protein EB001_22380 [bacterium]|nr:hypothetical protein [bacterium]